MGQSDMRSSANTSTPPIALSLGRTVIARSGRDEAISAENEDCFTPFAMTLLLNLMALVRRLGDELMRRRYAGLSKYSFIAV